MSRFLRSFCLAIIFGIFGIGALYIRYVMFPFQKTKKRNHVTLQNSWIFIIFLLKFCKVIRLNKEELDKIRGIKNSIIVSTHPSFIDIVILMSVIPYSTCFVSEKLSRNPFLKGVVNHLFILEGQDLDKWMNEACQKIDEGMNVIIFPMGTRHKKGEKMKIRRGASMLALKSHKDIVMLDIQTSEDFLQKHQLFCDAGKKIIDYKIEVLGTLKTEEYIEKYPDEVTFKTEVTKQIAKTLYREG